jgi:hypothetical protein
MPKQKKNPNAYPLGEKLGDIAKWTWEGMTNDIKKALNKGSKKLDIHREPRIYAPPEEPETPADKAALKDVFWGENLPQMKRKKKAK